MQIQILSVEVNNATSKSGKPYEQVVVAYKNFSDGGKVASKTLMPFGFQKDTFVTIKAAKPSDVFDIDVQKNEAGYNDWIRATKGATPANSVPTSGNNGRANAAPSIAASRGFETPEERAKRQIYIVRQSSLSAAVATLTVGRKSEVKPEEVIELAKQYEAFVFDTGRAEEVAKQDVGTIESIEEDLPF
jgi:hypothetical protein